MEQWAIVLSAISAFFAAIAATANWGQARKTSQANEVNVYLEMQTQYASLEMRTALSQLARFWTDNDGLVSDAFAAELSENPENAAILRGYTPFTPEPENPLGR